MTETSPNVDSAPAVVVSRRVAMMAAAGSALALAAGCGVDRRDDSRTARRGAATSTPLSGDIALLTRAIADEESLASFCAAAARRFPKQDALLDGLLERQRLHVARFRAVLKNLTPAVNRFHPTLPRRSRDLPLALGDLALGERNARSADCLEATSGLLAELFASAAASHAVTVQATEPKAAATTVVVADSVNEVDALQPCLAAEHAAVYGYALLGGVLAAAVSDTPFAKAVMSAYDAHRDRRDMLTELIGGAGGTPVVAEPAYDTPFPVAGAPTAHRLARYLEARCAAVYVRATAATTHDARLMLSGTLLDCAVRGARWGSPPTAFPGLD